LKYRVVTKKEYVSLAEIHILAFNDFFLTTLGYSFLKTYYKVALKDKETIAVCAVDEQDAMIGFSIGCLVAKGYHKRLLIRNLHSFAFQAIRILLTNPLSLLRLIHNLDKKPHPDDDGRYSELLSIAVSPLYKGLGVGKKIINCFEEEVKKNGGNKIALTTDLLKNEDVISFYQNVGYEVFYEFETYPNRKMYKLIKILY
jgi:ribosomal protein S18 acetylase RimI-like enzyme